MTGQLHRYSDLIRLFNNLFRDTYNTVLVKGGGEPLYLPAGSDAPYHQIIFAHGYFSSALHEISHWCIAGEQRRAQLDYGYWYLPDGRSESQQMQFEQVEIKPQALEWIFSVAAKHRFHMSIDNLGGEAFNRPLFANNLSKQVLNYLKVGMPGRAQTFALALTDFYQGKIIQEAFDPKSL
ncbi:MAG: elongation factor P hydroxylase [Pseudomonadales bacterium]|nr:elongation factor P hydroxylase [Pseudomonadales bacterium]MCP5214717.1 elongation factor P hydroxylase [Pseudomonadales bacterium]